MGKKERKKQQQRSSSPSSTQGQASSRWLWAGLGGGVLIIVVAVAAFLFWPQGSQSDLAAEPLPEQGKESLLTEVQSFPSEGRNHVGQGTSISYETTPPTSGSHYGRAAPTGFYTDSIPYGNLVHGLEHGAVVIYYNPEALTDAERSSLETFAQAHQDPWASVIVVPQRQPNAASPYILTAWTKMLKLSSYDARTVRAFLAEYLGRGPENPVR